MQRRSTDGRRLRAALLAAAVVAFVPAPALACPICFQVEDANTVSAIRAGVIVLMSVTIVVLSAVAAFSIRLWRNEKAVTDRSDA
jgi:hypothetical protein